MKKIIALLSLFLLQQVNASFLGDFFKEIVNDYMESKARQEFELFNDSETEVPWHSVEKETTKKNPTQKKPFILKRVFPEYKRILAGKPTFSKIFSSYELTHLLYKLEERKNRLNSLEQARDIPTVKETCKEYLLSIKGFLDENQGVAIRILVLQHIRGSKKTFIRDGIIATKDDAGKFCEKKIDFYHTRKPSSKPKTKRIKFNPNIEYFEPDVFEDDHD